MTKMDISLAADEAFAQHMGCTIASVLMNSRNDESFAFYILDGGISEASRNKILELRSIKPFEITWLEPDKKMFAGCRIIRNLTINTYFRLALPDLLPGLQRLLYVDSDMIVRCSLAELWVTNLSGSSVGAATDIGEMLSRSNTPSKTISRRLGLERPGFNSGLMLMDLAALRENRLFEQALDWIKEHTDKIVSSDQDGLNTVLNDSFVRLPTRYNVQLQPYYRTMMSKMADPENIQAYEKLDGIVHFIGKVKPWERLYGDPVGQLYWEVLKHTPWCDYKPPKPTLYEYWRFVKKKWFTFR